MLKSVFLLSCWNHTSMFSWVMAPSHGTKECLQVTGINPVKKYGCVLPLKFPSPAHFNYQKPQLPVVHKWGLDEQNNTVCSFLIKNKIKPEIEILKNLWRVSGAVALWSVCRAIHPLTCRVYSVVMESLWQQTDFSPFVSIVKPFLLSSWQPERAKSTSDCQWLGTEIQFWG